MSLSVRVAKLEGRAAAEAAARARLARVPVEDLSDEELSEMVMRSGYDLTLFSEAELNALRDCYTDAGDYLPERMTPDLLAALERVKL